MNKDKELMETVANNISDYIVDFENYSRFDDDTLEDYMSEFLVVWLDGSNEYAVTFGEELLFDGFRNESEAQKVYNWLYERAYEIAEQNKQ